MSTEDEKLRLQVRRAKELRAAGICPVCKAHLFFTSFRGEPAGGGHMSQCPEEDYWDSDGVRHLSSYRLEDALQRWLVKRLFFSHSLTTYNTSTEGKCLKFLRERYPCACIVNPRDVPLDPTWDFDTCMRRLLPEVGKCDTLVYYKDDSYSPGVDAEIEEALRLSIPIVKLKTSEGEGEIECT